MSDDSFLRLSGEAARCLVQEITTQVGCDQFPHPSQLAQPKLAAAIGLPRTSYSRVVKGSAFFLIDATRMQNGRFAIIEVNGSNGAYTSTLLGHDRLRAEHMATAAMRNVCRLRIDRGVILVLHQDGFHFPTEFYPRVLSMATIIGRSYDTEIKRPGEELTATLPIVIGTTKDAAKHIMTDDAGSMFYQGRRVIFVSNCNFLPELCRQGKADYTDPECRRTKIDTTIWHEGICFPIAHDKGLQQDLAEGTGIQPLRWAATHNKEEFLHELAAFHRDDVAAVAKINSGSGGTGIATFLPRMTESENGSRLEDLLAKATAKYGDQVHSTLWPIRLFEFATPMPLAIDGMPHAWDIRIACLLQPGTVTVYPTIVRRTPSPFSLANPSDTSGWLTNLSGRRRTMETVYSVLDPRITDTIIPISTLDEVLVASTRWCESAWQWAERNNTLTTSIGALPNGQRAAEYEHDAEHVDPHFYLNRQS